MAKKRVILNPTKQELLELEREVLGFNLTSIIGENKLKVEKYGYQSLRAINEVILSEKSIKGLKVAAVITQIEFKQSNAGKYFYWIHLRDDWTSYKVYCSEQTLKDNQSDLIKGRCVLFNINIKNDFASFDKCKIIENIPFKDGYIFVINLPYGKWTTAVQEYIEDEIDVTIRRGSCQVYLRTYGHDLSIDPSYDLMEKLEKRFGVNCSLELKENFLWGESNKLVKYMEECGY
jgi:hypothetical protein